MCRWIIDAASEVYGREKEANIVYRECTHMPCYQANTVTRKVNEAFVSKYAQIVLIQNSKLPISASVNGCLSTTDCRYVSIVWLDRPIQNVHPLTPSDSWDLLQDNGRLNHLL